MPQWHLLHRRIMRLFEQIHRAMTVLNRLFCLFVRFFAKQTHPNEPFPLVQVCNSGLSAMLCLSSLPFCIWTHRRQKTRGRSVWSDQHFASLILWAWLGVLRALIWKTKICKRSWKDHSRLDFLSSSSKWGLYKLISSAMSGSRTNLLSGLEPICLPATQAQVTQRTSGCRRGKDRQWMMEGLTWVEMTGREAESETASVKPIIWNKSDEFSSFKNDWTCREKESKLKPEIVFKTENIEDTMKITVQRELLLAGFSPLAWYSLL